jgi:hypothetical protein
MPPHQSRWLKSPKTTGAALAKTAFNRQLFTLGLCRTPIEARKSLIPHLPAALASGDTLEEQNVGVGGRAASHEERKEAFRNSCRCDKRLGRAEPNVAVSGIGTALGRLFSSLPARAYYIFEAI